MQVAIEFLQRQLAQKSSLFDDGKPEDAGSHESFILRLNALVWFGLIENLRSLPKSPSGAVVKNRQLHPCAELVVFGTWLMIDGHPGLARQGGRQADPRTVLKCVAACMREIQIRHDPERAQLQPVLKPARRKRITKHDLANRWNRLFNDTAEVSDFDARLRSTRRVLRAFMDHVASGAASFSGKRFIITPELTRVLDAITSGKASATSLTAAPVSIPPVPAVAAPFAFELAYSSPIVAAEFRHGASGALPACRLSYRIERCAPTTPTVSLRKDRVDRLLLVPDVTLRGCYRAKALVDRMVILVDTVHEVDRRVMQKTITAATSATVFVCDLTINAETQKWGAPLPIPDGSMQIGYHFAILIQDPTPKSLTAILDTIDRNYTITGNVGLHLVEISVDFYPLDPASTETSVLLREQMVGLLQRHHWAPGSALLRGAISTPSHVDSRQIYEQAKSLGKSPHNTRYLFAHKGTDGYHSDHDLVEYKVRQRVLTEQEGNQLYLNATLLKGARDGDVQIRIQHKIADQRNIVRGTARSLPERERRARIEVTISGHETLKERALSGVVDLTQISFRKLAKPCLTFRLGTCEPWQNKLDDAKTQMRTRGVYGLDLKERARAVEAYVEKRGLGTKPAPKVFREGRALVDWPEMNRLVGDALDGLTKRWARFSWQ